ncbi:hypothetical protein [Mycobacterium sp. NPDC050853]|uniref:hypothetical protein n=1 Tax=Mycobacterium sp. NPDC050853 TaxID=3155160 RepID=UPI0033D461C8
MTYRVLAPLVIVKPHGGYHYAGSVIPHLTPAQEAHLLSEGLVERIDAGEANAVDVDPSESAVAEADASQGGATKPPAKVAPVEDWIAYAVSRGADPAEAGALDKQELQELYG